jgi:hypothetical protein
MSSATKLSIYLLKPGDFEVEELLTRECISIPVSDDIMVAITNAKKNEPCFERTR